MATLEITVKVNNDGSVELKKLTNTAKEAENATKSLNKSTDSLSNSYGMLRSAIGGLALGAMIRETVRMADTYKLMQGRLSLVTNSTEQLVAVQSELFKIAQDSRVGYEATVDLYSRLARSTEELNVSQTDLLDVTEAINKSFIISGASAQSAEAAIIQLGQAFASGTLRGDELNSIMEQSPRLAEAIAKGMKVSVGELRALGAEGKITAEAVFKAIRDQGVNIEAEFAKMPKTVDQSIVQVQNSLLDLVGTTDSATGSTNDFADSLTALSVTLSENKAEIVEFGLDTFRSFQLMGTGVLMIETGIEAVAMAIPKSLAYGLGLGLLKIQGFLNESLKVSESAVNKIQSFYGGDKVSFGQLDFAKPVGGNPFGEQMKEFELEMTTAKKLYSDIANMTTVIKKPKDFDKGGGGGGGGNGNPPDKKAEAEALRAYQTLLTETANIENEIYALTHSEHEVRMKEIDDQAKKYRDAKVDEALVVKFITESKRKENEDYAKKLSDDLKKQSEDEKKKQEEFEKPIKDRLSAQTELYKEMNQMSGNFYDNELVRIAEVAQAMAEKGVDDLEIIKYVKRAQSKAYDNLGLGVIEAADVAKNAVKEMEDAFVDAFMTGKFEADKMFQAIAADIARLTIRNTLTASISSGIASLFLPSANGNAFSGGNPIHAFADGGAFTNSVVSSPTVAPMALFGEAGPEAIMPLQRTSDGKLGVMATNQQQSQNIKVEIINQSGQDIQATQSSSRFDGEQFVISVMIDAIRRNKGGMKDIISGGR
jgi:tape measure domain-containing protein